MLKSLLFILAIGLVFPATSMAGAIKYIGNGKGGPEVKVSFCRGNSAKWEHHTMKPGQMLSIPKDATHLTLKSDPRNPNRDYIIQDKNVFRSIDGIFYYPL